MVSTEQCKWNNEWLKFSIISSLVIGLTYLTPPSHLTLLVLPMNYVVHFKSQLRFCQELLSLNKNITDFLKISSYISSISLHKLPYHISLCHNRSLHSTITTFLYIFHYFDISHACPIKVNNYFDISHACPTNYLDISHACPIKVKVKVKISIYDIFSRYLTF